MGGLVYWVELSVLGRGMVMKSISETECSERVGREESSPHPSFPPPFLWSSLRSSSLRWLVLLQRCRLERRFCFLACRMGTLLCSYSVQPRAWEKVSVAWRLSSAWLEKTVISKPGLPFAYFELIQFPWFSM